MTPGTEAFVPWRAHIMVKIHDFFEKIFFSIVAAVVVQLVRAFILFSEGWEFETLNPIVTNLCR